jgi:YVTN family beta-propeller protein
VTSFIGYSPPRLAHLSRWLGLLLLAMAGLCAVAQAQSAPIFVLNSLSASVSVIDPVSWREIKRIPTGKEPHHLYLAPDEKSLIIANALSDSLLFVDPKTADVQRTVRGILDPYQLRFSPDMKWFVTAANRLNHIDIYRWVGKEPILAKRIATGETPATSGSTAKAARSTPPCRTATSLWPSTY